MKSTSAIEVVTKKITDMISIFNTNGSHHMLTTKLTLHCGERLLGHNGGCHEESIVCTAV